MKRDTLSLFRFFGGKNRFCKEIAELLDYDNTDVYIEPFGGSAAVLLNKPAHPLEIYSDVSQGLVALMQHLSDPDKASVLIDCLYDTEYSEECFLENLKYRNSVDRNWLEKQQKELIKKRKRFFNKFKRKFIASKNKINVFKNLPTDNAKLDFIKNFINEKFSSKEIEELFSELNEVLYEMEVFESNEDVGLIPEVDPLKLAVATFVTYVMSRDGMGTGFSSAVFNSSEAYYRRIDKLYDVAERLKGVHIQGSVGALSYLLENSYLNNERAMFYIDAPYLSPDEDELNLGHPYIGQMTQEDHVLLLETIVSSKAKFLISNYDTPTYNKYLSGWNKVTIDTATSVGGKKDNKRVECLWYNY